VADVINRTFPRLLLIVSPSNLDAPQTPGSYAPTKPGWPADARSPQDARSLPVRHAYGRLVRPRDDPVMTDPAHILPYRMMKDLTAMMAIRPLTCYFSRSPDRI
jgi:hypothetical protein